MKSLLLTFLLVAIVLFVVVESRRGFKRGGQKWRKGGDHGKPHGRPWTKRRCGKARTSNCSEFVNDTCMACDDGFALKEINFPRCKKQFCVPCSWRLKSKDPGLYLRQCVNECPKNCSSCEDGVCKECEPGFFSVQTRLIQRTVCVPCGLRMKKFWPDVYLKECTEEGCGKGCANCSAPGLCTHCDEGLKLITPPYSNITKCVGKCPPFYKLDPDSSAPRCQLKPKPSKKCGKFCQSCSEEGICLKCIKPRRRIKVDLHITCGMRCPLLYRGRFDPDSRITICEKLPRKFGKGGKISDVH